MTPTDRRITAQAFLSKAKEYLAVAQDAFAQDRQTAAAGNAIHLEEYVSMDWRVDLR